MAYKKIILGFGLLHLLILGLLVYCTFNNNSNIRSQVSEDIGEIKTSMVKSSLPNIDNTIIQSIEPDDDYKKFFIILTCILSIFPFIAFSTVVAKKIRKYKRKQIELIGENKNKDLFFSVISHDLKNPAQQLIALSDMLCKENSIELDDYQKISLLINTCAKKHYDLLNNLLAWSTSQLHGKVIPKYTLNLYELIEQQIMAQKEKIDEKKLNVSNEIDKNIIILSNENLLGTVFRNILSNAIKFTSVGGNITFEVKITGNEQLLVYIKDSGVGMTKDILKNLFNLKYIRSMRGTNKEVGSGIGLILCKEIIDKLKGKITVQSEENVGSVFIIKLPF